AAPSPGPLSLRRTPGRRRPRVANFVKVAAYFFPEEWGYLWPVPSAVCRNVMRETYTYLGALRLPDSKPVLISWGEQEAQLWGLDAQDPQEDGLGTHLQL
uniref:KRAB domain-containing protein n=1 Tax=Panthera leo TaxID=9689 RepID=A0A8C8XJ45_PANLE